MLLFPTAKRQPIMVPASNHGFDDMENRENFWSNRCGEYKWKKWNAQKKWVTMMAWEENCMDQIENIAGWRDWAKACKSRAKRNKISSTEMHLVSSNNNKKNIIRKQNLPTKWSACTFDTETFATTSFLTKTLSPTEWLHKRNFGNFHIWSVRARTHTL